MSTPRVATLDTETTGVDVYGDRIVTAFFGIMDGEGRWVERTDWLLNPMTPIPVGASDVHGITDEIAQRDGRTDLKEAIWEIAERINSLCNVEIAERPLPLVVYNAPFDLTLLRAEIERHEVPQEIDPRKINVLDPLVLDKMLDKYRRGKRTLTAVAPVYGVPVELNAHDASADCLMAGRIALRMAGHAMLRGRTMAEIQEMQRNAKAEQAGSFQSYLRSAKAGEKRDPEAVIDKGWPIYSNGPK